MNILTYWSASDSRTPVVKTPADVQQRLQAAAADISKHLGVQAAGSDRRKYQHEQWSAIGVDPVQSNISSQGAAYRRGERLRVVVRADNPLLRQRYTIAHEIGHCLLRQLLESSSVQLERKQEEVFCDQFAAKILVPESALAALIQKLKGAAPTSKVILEWCRELEVNILPMLIALNSQWTWPTSAVLYCQNFAHRSDSESALRVVNYAAPERLYLPRNKRVHSLGLRSLDDWFVGAQGGYAKGADQRVRLPLYERDTFSSKTGFIEGEVDWTAMRLNDNTQGSGRVFVDLTLVGDWALKWAGGVPKVFEPARLLGTKRASTRTAKTSQRKGT